MSELLAPGGSFAAAIRAFENGADAVYLGLSEFSARKGAVNFSLDHLRRLRAAWPDKSLYLALNTLVPDNALFRAAEQIMEGLDAGINAVIAQDPGIARIAGKLCPSLPLHASTQMAVYDKAGAAELQDAGFSRVVLARECSLKEIREIREALPDLELEIFVHGALCYGFSGLCQASQSLLGRSANRGACGQICRTWFEEGEHHLYPFSQNDLALGERVSNFVALGISSLKIEGRMKNPEYVGSVCAYYRGILEGESGNEALGEEAALRFSRNQTEGWLAGGKGKEMLNPEYPGPTGVPACRVLSVDGRGARVEALRNLGSRDGLLWFVEGNPPRPIREALRFREKGRHSLEKGKEAWLETRDVPGIGSELRLLSRGDGRWGEVKAASYTPAATPISLKIHIESAKLVLKGQRDDFSWRLRDEGVLETARNPGHFVSAVEKIFTASGDSQYRCSPIDVEIPSSGPEPFLPPKQMKALRRRFLEGFAAAYEAWKKLRISAVLDDILGSDTGSPEQSLNSAVHVLQNKAPGISRSELSSPSWSPLPFPVDLSKFGFSDIPAVDGTAYLPLPPHIFAISAETLLDTVARLVDEIDKPLCIGLNNQGHVFLARRLMESRGVHIASGKLSFFLDYGLYVVNRQAWAWYRERIPGLSFFVQGLESESDQWPGKEKESLNLPWIPLGEGFPMPLFISRTCSVHHAGLDGNTRPGTCPENCGGNRDFKISQNDRPYRIVIRNCISYVLAD